MRGIQRDRPCKRGHDEWIRSHDPRRQYWRCGACRYEQEKARRLQTAADKRATELPNSKRPSPTDWPEGYHHHPAPPVARIPIGYVRNDAIRDAVIKAQRWDPDLTIAEIAQRCGWVHSRKVTGGDTTRVYRILGMVLYMDKKARGGFAYRQLILEDDAATICRAIHVDPWEVGL